LRRIGVEHLVPVVEVAEQERRVDDGAAFENVDMCRGDTIPYRPRFPWFMNAK